MYSRVQYFMRIQKWKEMNFNRLSDFKSGNNRKRSHIAAHDRATFQNTEKYDCLTEKV